VLLRRRRPPERRNTSHIGAFMQTRIDSA